MTVKELIKRSGMTQRKFSEYFDIPQRTVERWVSGSNTCADYLVKLMMYKLYKEGIISDISVLVVENTEGKDSVYAEMQFNSNTITIDEVFDALGLDYEFDTSCKTCCVFEVKRGKRTGRRFTVMSKKVSPEGIVADDAEYKDFWVNVEEGD